MIKFYIFFWIKSILIEFIYYSSISKHYRILFFKLSYFLNFYSNLWSQEELHDK